MIKLIIFDLCGVVFHCEEPPFFRYFSEVYHSAFDEVEAVYGEHMKKAELGQIPAKKALELFLDHFNIHADLDEMFEQLISFKGYNRETIEILKKLKKKYKLAYLTNSSVELMKLSEEHLPIFHYFDYGIISANIKARKPDPKGFQLILEHFTVKPEETIFIDDGEKNLINAREMGMKTIHFLNSEQLAEELKKQDVEL